MSDRFVVEANRQVVGIAVRVPGGFQFFCSNPDYRGLEGTVFPRARSVEGVVAEHARRLSEKIPGGRLQ